MILKQLFWIVKKEITSNLIYLFCACSPSPTLKIRGKIDWHVHIVKLIQEIQRYFNVSWLFSIVSMSVSNLFPSALIFLLKDWQWQSFLRYLYLEENKLDSTHHMACLKKSKLLSFFNFQNIYINTGVVLLFLIQCYSWSGSNLVGIFFPVYKLTTQGACKFKKILHVTLWDSLMEVHNINSTTLDYTHFIWCWIKKLILQQYLYFIIENWMRVILR